MYGKSARFVKEFSVTAGNIFYFYRKKEQNENPGAAIQAIKYYNYSIKKKPNETFKPLVTEEAIKEESEEIENILGIFSILVQF